MDQSYTHDLLYYDVREYYSTEATYSPWDWLSIYGQIAPKAAANDSVSISSIKEYSLSCFPNPFNPTTKISYTLKEKDHVTLVVFDILGKEVARLVDGIQTEGEHSVNFDGSSLPSGMYIYQLQGTNFNISKKMLLLK